MKPGMMNTQLAAAAAFCAGVLALVVFRLILAAPEPPVHYHANFAVFVQGERYDFSGDRYMQDVAACPGDVRDVPPASRVHLHNNDPDVVHVHHGGVTWGHLLANLGFVLGDEVLVTSSGETHLDGAGGTLKFIVNGRPDPSIRNRTIRPRDRLLISFGPESESQVMESQFPEVATNAAGFDEIPDPAGCGGPDEPTLRERLRHAIFG
jgi:hypothetical protein